MKNKITSLFAFLLITILLISCNEKSSHNYPPLDKRYWTIEDFENASREIQYNYSGEDELPNFKNSETKPILDKLLDTNNFKVVLEDNELGIKYRNEIATRFFEAWRNISNTYSSLDKKDKYIYEDEHIAVINYGLELQLYYFKLGNEEIKKSSEDPNYSNVQNTIKSNVNILVNNFLNFLDEINNEDSYSNNGKVLFANTIDKNFTSLINENPNADFVKLKQKLELFIKKTNSPEIRNTLENLLKLVLSKQEQTEVNSN